MLPQFELPNIKDILKKYCIQYKPFGIRLASGKTSLYYINIKNIMFDYRTFNKLLDAVDMEICLKTRNFDCIGSDEGCSPIVSGLVARRQVIQGFRVRSKQKDHGMESQVEGHLSWGNRVILIEDVFTTGQSLLKTAGIIRNKYNVQHIDVVAVINRSKLKKIDNNNISIHSICHFDETTGTLT